MAYNPYAGPYGPPPAYGGYPGANGPPGMAPPPGLGPPPGMSSAPGMAPPPGVQQQLNNASQANRPSGLPANFQPPPNLPNINFNAPVIRLGSTAPPSRPSPTAGMSDRRDSNLPSAGGPGSRLGLGTDRGDQSARGDRATRENAHQLLLPPTAEERLRTIFVHQIPDGVGGEDAVQRLLGVAGRVRKWSSARSHMDAHKGALFGFAQYADPDSLALAVELFKDIEVPVKKQKPTEDPPEMEPITEAKVDDGVEEEEEEGKEEDDKEDAAEEQANKDGDKGTDQKSPERAQNDAQDETPEKQSQDGDAKEKPRKDQYPGIDKTKLLVAFDESTARYVESLRRAREPESAAVFQTRLVEASTALRRCIHELFYPPLLKVRDADGDTAMADGGASVGENVEVLNIPLAQEDELADIPPEMREVVAAEIAAFRERSNQRDMERLKREEEYEEMERRRNGAPRPSHLDSPPAGNSNSVPLGPRGVANAPSGPRGQNRVDFVNGGAGHGRHASWARDEDDDTDASDDELHRRELATQRSEEDRLYLEAERKWVNRERQRAAALGREKDRDQNEEESFARRRQEQLEREKNWDDEREASRKGHGYYRDRATWARKRATERADEEARDDMDRRAEEEEHRKVEGDRERARGLADPFLEQQAEETEQPPQPAAAATPQRFTISFGAAAQKAQAQRAAPQRRTIAEVEGLLDDEEQEQTTKRQLVPIKFEPIDNTKAMSEEDIHAAVRALAHEIPTDRDGLWAWPVSWEFFDDEGAVRAKIREFLERKVVSYLGIQDQFLVEMVENHIKRPSELVVMLGEALDDDAEDFVRTAYRALVFFTEASKRDLPV